MKKSIFILLLSCLSLDIAAQESGFSSLRDEFDSFREQVKSEYTQFLGQAWREFKIEKGVEYEPSPISTPPIKTKEDEGVAQQEIEAAELQVQEVITPVKNRYTSWEIDENLGKNINIEFYGASLNLYYSAKPFSTNNPILEREVVAFWQELLQSNYTLLLADLAKYKEELQLNDGAFYLLTKQVVRNIAALKDDNQRVIFHLFILIESGYDARIARVENFLSLLLPTHEYIYGYPYSAVFDGQRYHLFTDKKINADSKMSTYEIPHNIKRQSNLSFKFDREVLLPQKPHPFVIKHDNLVIEGEVNKNKIDLYNDYPVCDLSVYKHSTVDYTTKEKIVSSLKAQLSELAIYDAINRLLSLVQYGFDYEVDATQFGYERPLFVEEVLFYPQSDCEDRSIFLTFLVESIFNRETFFLDYPGHISVAINIEPQGSGRYFKYKGNTYTCCDPTYYGSALGDCMDMFKSVTPKLIE